MRKPLKPIANAFSIDATFLQRCRVEDKTPDLKPSKKKKQRKRERGKKEEKTIQKREIQANKNR